MRTKKKMAALLLVMIGLTLICAGRSNADDANTVLSWDWDDCLTTEGWEGNGSTIVTLEDGQGTDGCGLGADQTDPSANVTIVQIGGQTLDPSALVGGEFGMDLPMTGEIDVDIDRQVPVGGEFSSFIELLIMGEDSVARFVYNPDSGAGSIEDLGEGWYRYSLVNRSHYAGSYPDAGYFYLEWNWAEDVEESPLVFDNLKIVHEPVPVEVGVDIRPALCPNPLSVISKGMLPVAIVGTNEFDVNEIQPTSVSIVIGEVEISAVRHSYKDVATTAEPCVCPSSFGPNGFTDLLLDFRTKDIIEALGDVSPDDVVELDFAGRLRDLTPIWGSDCVLIRDEML